MKFPALSRLREIEATQKRLTTEKFALEAKAATENGVHGLLAMGRRRALFMPFKMNHLCIEGDIKTPNGADYELQREFGQGDYHSRLNFKVDGFDLHFSADDGHLRLFVSLPNPAKPIPPGEQRATYEAMLPQTFKRFRRLFRKFRINVSAAKAANKIAELEQEASVYRQFSAAIGALK